MTRIRKTVSIVTAIILCVLTLGTAMCTWVCTPCGDVRNAQFFAMPFSQSLNTAPAPSLASSEKRAVITWLRKKDPIFDEDNVYKLTGSSTGTGCKLSRSPGNIAFKTDLYNPVKNISYYMRI